MNRQLAAALEKKRAEREERRSATPELKPVPKTGLRVMLGGGLAPGQTKTEVTGALEAPVFKAVEAAANETLKASLGFAQQGRALAAALQKKQEAERIAAVAIREAELEAIRLQIEARNGLRAVQATIAEASRITGRPASQITYDEACQACATVTVAAQAKADRKKARWALVNQAGGTGTGGEAARQREKERAQAREMELAKADMVRNGLREREEALFRLEAEINQIQRAAGARLREGEKAAAKLRRETETLMGQSYHDAMQGVVPLKAAPIRAEIHSEIIDIPQTRPTAVKAVMPPNAVEIDGHWFVERPNGAVEQIA